MIEISEPRLKLVMSASSSSYPTLGASYVNDINIITYSPRLVRTGKNYRDSIAEIQEGIRMSTAAEELAIQLALERAGEYPTKAEVFHDLFGRGPENNYILQFTGTILRVPKGRDAEKYETDAQGRKYYPRIVLLGDKEVGEILVPEGNSRLVDEWDEVFGIPKVTINNVVDTLFLSHKPNTTHFRFDIDPEPSKTGQKDVVINRGGYWPLATHYNCFLVDASWMPLIYANPNNGFRPVKGQLQAIKKM